MSTSGQSEVNNVAHSSTLPLNYTSTDLETELDDGTLVMLTLLHLAHGSRPELRNLLPESSRLVLDNYLSMKDREPPLDDEEDMEEFAQIKEHEIAYLRRQIGRVEVAKKQCHDRMRELLRQQLVLSKGSREWKAMQRNHVEPMKERFRVLQTAIKVLPDLIATAEERHRSVSQKLHLRRQAMQDEEKKQEQDLATDCEKLRKMVDNYLAWKHYAVPASSTFAQLHAKYEAALAQLNVVELEAKKDAIV
ncbi:hypothetical protein PT974_04354 [Cladobotryum mycophilum]|uniref:Uncharacterized protein n=1 Tax=Cladobotryum mycophilum TaxID=491253 RepID=A0ABR0SUS3_9HYPO